jgi:hypothetical protein
MSQADNPGIQADSGMGLFRIIDAAFSGQRSAVSVQRSAVSGQLSAVSNSIQFNSIRIC